MNNTLMNTDASAAHEEAVERVESSRLDSNLMAQFTSINEKLENL